MFINAAASRFGQQYVWGRLKVLVALPPSGTWPAAPCEGGGWGLLSREDASHCWDHPGGCFFSGWVCASCTHELPGTRNQTCWSSPSPRAAESPVQSTLGDGRCDVLALQAGVKNWRRRITSPPPDSPPEMWRANNGRKG